MSRNPERAENPTRSTATAIIPPKLRVPVFGARLFLAVLAGGAGAQASASRVAEGADPDCRVGVRIESYTYFDMAQVAPEMGRRHIIDIGIDPRAGAAAGFVVDAVPVSFKAGDRDKVGFRPLGSTNIVRDQKDNVGRGQIEFTTGCNTTAVTSDGKREPALRFKLVSNLDPNNDQFEVVTPSNRRSVVAFGSEIKKAQDFLGIVNAGMEIKDLDANKKALIAKSVQSATAAATPVADKTPEPSGIERFLKDAWGGAGAAINLVTDLPAKAVDQITEPDAQGSVRTGVDIVGWLALLALLRLLRRAPNATVTAGTTGSTGSSIPPTFSLGGIIGALGGPSNPNTSASTGPTQPKTPNPEWITGQQEFEKRWQAAKSKLSPVRLGDTGNEPEYILDRFKAGMNVVHEVSLDDAIKVAPMATRVRAGLEHLIPEIWPDSGIFKKFFDPQINAGFLTPEDLAKIIYLPEQYRTLSKFTDVQRKDVRRIHRILMHALHPDNSKSEADPNLQNTIDDLLKKINPAWSYIDRLIK